MINYGDQDYEVQKGDKIAQLIVEKIMGEEIVLVKEVDITERGVKGFGSSDTGMNEQVATGANLLTNQCKNVTRSTDHRKDHSPCKRKIIHISEIRQKEFCQP